MLAGVVQFAFGFIPLAAMLVIFFHHRISPYLLLIPVVAAVQFVFTFAFGLTVAALNVFFRDIGNLSRHVLRLWFYLGPALYGADTIAQLDPSISRIMQLNPFFAILESYRDAIYYGRLPNFGLLLSVLAASLVFVVIATLLFKRLEPAFAQVLSCPRRPPTTPSTSRKSVSTTTPR